MGIRARVSRLTLQALVTTSFSSVPINFGCLVFLIRPGQSEPIFINQMECKKQQQQQQMLCSEVEILLPDVQYHQFLTPLT